MPLGKLMLGLYGCLRSCWYYWTLEDHTPCADRDAAVVYRVGSGWLLIGKKRMAECVIVLPGGAGAYRAWRSVDLEAGYASA